MGLIRDLFMSWKVCSVVFAVWTTNVWMRVSCQIFKSNVSSESSKPVWVGGTWWRSTQNSERNRSGQGSPHFSQPFFVPPDLWCTGLVCFLFFVVSFFSMSIRVALRNLWSRRPLWLIACTDHQGASFHFSPLSDSKCSVAILGNAEITSFPKIPTMLDTLRDCWWKKSGQHHLGCIIPVESIMAINYFASWPDFWSIRRITKKLLERFAQNSIKLLLKFLQTRATSESTGIFNQRFLEVGNSTLWAAGAAGCLGQAERWQNGKVSGLEW